jgi:hypothetical protein
MKIINNIEETRKIDIGQGIVNENLQVLVLDNPGVGGANHCYAIVDKNDPEHKVFQVINFQNGAVKEVKEINGITNEALLAIIIDRLQGFMEGQFPSEQSAKALEHCQQALTQLNSRTKERQLRGVEGKHEA